MQAAPIIFVTGPPGSGKTTLACELTVGMGAPLLEKDGLKEALYDELTVRGLLDPRMDRQRSDQVSDAVFAMLFGIASRFPEAVPVVMEGDFREEDIPASMRVSGRPFIEVHVTCERSLRLRRHATRATSTRHPVHSDDEGTIALLSTLPDSTWPPLGLGTLIAVDTTHGANIDVLSAVRAAAHGVRKTSSARQINEAYLRPIGSPRIRARFAL